MNSEGNEQNKKMMEEHSEHHEHHQEQQEENHHHNHNGEGSRGHEEAAQLAKQLKESSDQVNEKQLENRLTEAVNCYKNKNFDQAENIFSDLMICAVKFYKEETHVKMSKFFFFYGDMLLTKLENNPDVFGDKAQKKLDNNTVEEGEKPSNQMTAEEPSEQKMRVQGEQKEDEEDDEEGQQEGDEEEIVQLDTVVFKDENVEIRDETNVPEEKEGNEGAEVSNIPIGKVSLEKSDPIDDLQLAWEHLELSRKIYNKELLHIQESSDDDKKEKQVQVSKQIVEVTLRLADLESWRDNLSEAVKEYSKALEISRNIEDRENSRTLSSIYYQLGNALLYENKDFCEEEALRNFIDSAQILENCLSCKIAIPPQELPSFKILKKEDIKTDHLKHSFLDDEESKEIKDTLKSLYEKVEDTLIQRDDRDKYKAYQELMKKQTQTQNQFAQPTQNNVPIKNLGTFGSLKRKEPSSESTNTSQNGSSNTMNVPQSNCQEGSNSTIIQMNPDGTADKQLKKD